MKKIDKNTFLVEGNLYVNIPFAKFPLVNCKCCNTIQVRGDVFFEILQKPNRLSSKDYYMNYEEFFKKHGYIYDIICEYS